MTQAAHRLFLAAALSFGTLVSLCACRPRPTQIQLDVHGDLRTAYAAPAAPDAVLSMRVEAGSSMTSLRPVSEHTFESSSVAAFTEAFEGAQYDTSQPLQVRVTAVLRDGRMLKRNVRVRWQASQLLRARAGFGTACFDDPCADGSECGAGAKCEPLEPAVEVVPRAGVPFH